jgi:hypothetical protein
MAVFSLNYQEARNGGQRAELKHGEVSASFAAMSVTLPSAGALHASSVVAVQCSVGQAAMAIARIIHIAMNGTAL